MSDQNHIAIIQQGRAMVRLIEAADALLPAADERESRYLRDLQTGIDSACARSWLNCRRG